MLNKNKQLLQYILFRKMENKGLDEDKKKRQEPLVKKKSLRQQSFFHENKI